MDDLFGHRDDERVVLGYLMGDGQCCSDVAALVGDLGEQTPLQGLVGAESASTQDQVGGPAVSERARRPGDAARGRQDAYLDFGKAEDGRFVGDPDVSGQAEPRPPPRQ